MTKKRIVAIFLLISASFLSIGYAQLTDVLNISGSVSVEPAQNEQYDIYITDVSPVSGGTMTVEHYFSTVVTTSIYGASQTTFTITVTNQSDKTYVFERIVQGSETGFEGIYTGNGVSYTLDGLTRLQEVAPGATHTFRVTMKSDATVNSDNVLTLYKFIEKTGDEVLPGAPGDNEPEDTQPEDTQPEDTQPEDTQPEDTQPEDTQPEDTQPEDPTPPAVDADNNFYGLLDVLLSKEIEDSLNHQGDKGKDVIYNAVQKELANEPYILHCLTKSVQGGNMANITQNVNTKLSVKMHYIMMPVKGDANALHLYMYQADDLADKQAGKIILTYFTVLRYSPDKEEWEEDGVYVGKAEVAFLDGGGNSGQKAWMIDPTTWTSGAP